MFGNLVFSPYLCIKIDFDIMLRVNEICKEKGMTLKDLAKKLGVTYQSLYANLKETGNPTLSKLKEIADALGVEVVELFAPVERNVFTCPNCGKRFRIVEDTEV